MTRAFAGAARRFGAEVRLGVNVTDLLVEGGRVRGVQTDKGPVRGDLRRQRGGGMGSDAHQQIRL